MFALNLYMGLIYISLGILKRWDSWYRDILACLFQQVWKESMILTENEHLLFYSGSIIDAG